MKTDHLYKRLLLSRLPPCQTRKRWESPWYLLETLRRLACQRPMANRRGRLNTCRATRAISLTKTRNRHRHQSPHTENNKKNGRASPLGASWRPAHFLLCSPNDSPRCGQIQAPRAGAQHAQLLSHKGRAKRRAPQEQPRDGNRTNPRGNAMRRAPQEHAQGREAGWTRSTHWSLHANGTGDGKE